MANNERFYSIFLLFLISINLISCEKSLITNQAALFVFGDSVFDVGNNNYINTHRAAQANVWPYGQTTFKFPTGRNSDGRLIPDFIGISKSIYPSYLHNSSFKSIYKILSGTIFATNAAEYAWLPLIPPYLQPGNGVNQFTYGVNFASAGAGALVETYQLQVFNYYIFLTSFSLYIQFQRYS